MKFKIKTDEDNPLKDKVRTADNWYDVPLGAIPVIEEGDPAMPEYMDGRQYFLWAENGFKEGKDGAVILDPYPKYNNPQFVPAGDNSRRWGA